MAKSHSADMPWREAIVAVLRDATKALHYTEITDVIIEKGLRKNLGATPSSTVNANVAVDIKKHGDRSVFIRVGPGEFALRAALIDQSFPLGSHNSSAPVNDASGNDAPLTDETEDVGVISAFGMYWRRDAVRWNNTPLILGQQDRKAETVNFAPQKGIYLLHDGGRTVYVGRSVDRPLGRRLYEHTFDRLNGRWDRFSWFGLSRVTTDGKLEEQLTFDIKPAILIATLEALLIESLEPPLNRKRGDEFRAVEYLQAEDPQLRQQQEKAIVAQLLSKIGQ